MSIIETGKTQKYLIYAVGEVVLVVIGILLALQINNWNEWSKDRAKEKVILNEIVASLEKNNQAIVERMYWVERFKKSGKTIIQVLEEEIPYSDTLNAYFLNCRFSGLGNLQGLMTDAGYNALRLAGYDIIQSDSLKMQIIEMFDSTIPVLSGMESGIRSKFQDYYFQHFKHGQIPRNLDQLKNDPIYYEMVNFLIGFRVRALNRMQQFLDQSNGLIDIIKEELTRIE